MEAEVMWDFWISSPDSNGNFEGKKPSIFLIERSTNGSEASGLFLQRK
jgi:hypothetical protein